MTIEMVREEIPNIEVIKQQICNCCKSNDAYCRKECGVLKQAERCGLEKLQRIYAKYDGAEWEVARYLQAKNNKSKAQENLDPYGHGYSIDRDGNVHYGP